MRLTEYQGMRLLNENGLRASEGVIAASAEEAAQAYACINARAVVKAMIPVGGRGKAGLVKLVDSPEAAKAAAEAILGRTHGGYTVRELIVSPARAVREEWYLSVIYNPAKNHPVLMFSTEGGMDIEAVADKTPEKICTFDVDNALGAPLTGLSESLLMLGIPYTLAKRAERYARKLALLAHEKKLTLAEINPLSVTDDGKLMALDCKIELDDAMVGFYPEYAEANLRQSNALERQVKAVGGTLVELAGDIGVICNGAGMGMAIVDMMADQGLSAANFLDTGGGPNKEKTIDICRVMFAQTNLRGLIISFWGGFSLLDNVAEGIVEVARESNWTKPLVVKMFGIHQEKAQEILKAAGILVAPEMQTEKAVKMLADALRGAEV